MKTLEDVLQEITPQPDPDFVAEMERRMKEGFPAPDRKRTLRERLPRMALPDLRPRAAAGVAASAVLALLVTVSLVDRDESDRAGGGGGAGVLSEESAQDSGGASGGRALSAPDDSTAIAPPDATRPVPPIEPPRGDGVAPNARTRRVERSAQLTLAADPAGFDRLANAIFRVAERHRGFVLHSSFAEGEEDGVSTGIFDIRVPVTELNATLNELSRIATVRLRSETGNDVTGSVISVRDNLRNAQAERRGLLRRLERADTEIAAEALRRQLQLKTQEIAGMRANLRGLRERTNFAAVSVELVDEDDGAAGSSKGEADEALDDALGYLEDILSFLIRAAAIVIPALLASVIGWLVAARLRRRARERTLA